MSFSEDGMDTFCYEEKQTGKAWAAGIFSIMMLFGGIRIHFTTLPHIPRIGLSLVLVIMALLIFGWLYKSRFGRKLRCLKLESGVLGQRYGVSGKGDFEIEVGSITGLHISRWTDGVDDWVLQASGSSYPLIEMPRTEREAFLAVLLKSNPNVRVE